MDVIYQPAAGPAVTVKGIFGDPYVLEEHGLSGVEALAPTIFLKLASLPIHPDFDTPTLTIDGITYRVVERRPAGLGAISLALRKVV